MRTLFATLALTASLALSVAAHADVYDVTYTPSSGSAYSYSFDTSSPYYVSPYEFEVLYLVLPQYSEYAAFENPVALGGYGYGPIDYHAFGGENGGENITYDGVSLFTGSVSDPVFKTGTFQLGPSAFEGNNSGTATLTITDASTPVSSATPEPSSMILLGTGILGMAGAARRRFFVNR
jgi:PEP-CTERM motif